MFKFAVAGLVGALAFLGSASAAPQRLPAAQKAPSADPLVGTWDTAPIPLARIRAAFTAYGYKTDAIDKFFKNQAFLHHIKKTVKSEMRFYREPGGAPFQIVVFWDPTTGPEPSYAGADHGPYTLLPGHRVTTRGTDPPTDKWVTTYSYTVTRTQLKLRFIKFVQPSENEKNRLAYQKLFIMYAAAPYKKVGAR